MELPPVEPERIVEILRRTDLGRALWTAATLEAVCEVQQQRIDQLEKQQEPAGA